MFEHMVWYGTWKAAGARFLILASRKTISTEIPGKYRGKQYTEERVRPLSVAVGDREVTITGRYIEQSASLSNHHFLFSPGIPTVHDGLRNLTFWLNCYTDIRFRQSTNCRRRLIRDFKRLSTDPPSGISGSPCPDNIMLWNAVIFGPGTPL